MNMIAPIKSADIRGAKNLGAETRSDIFGRLEALIAERPWSLDAARAEARQLVSEAMADTCQFDTLWGAADAFHAHFEFMMQTVEIDGASGASLENLRMRCRFYLEEVEALCLASRYR
ncbi:hypothetical protein OHD62_14220 [Mesorhizobium sp. YC-39]|uniref:hypothetical protein n=1 Tax=unclassified Mesorhizobium TaxID=325217 RepID=UPI0021E95D03|nr:MULTISPECIES: hypothetical protein [unclassified Mesorhizobium]MCV3207795.1 hypothetical protein [Mesorhizobium sp. YC-2]MCV3229522.1 hypothetical protein [Mesorhizobium sp. YC-39]